MAALEKYGIVNDSTNTLNPFETGVPCLESDVCDLATELFFNVTITTINFSNIKLGVEACTALGKALGAGSHSVVAYVKLRGCGINEESIAAFCRNCRGNKRIEILDVSNNSLRDEGSAHLAALVESLPYLRVLEASECKIGALGATAIAGGISRHRRLQHLDLSQNKLREKGFAALAKGIQENSSLTSLDVGSNHINVEGGAVLADLLLQNKTIESLNVRNNYFSSCVPRIMLSLCKRGVPARYVNLSRNRITSEICRETSIVLEGAKLEIACFSLEGNEIGSEGLVAVFHAVRGSNVQFLDLSQTALTPASGVVLADLIRACPVLNSLQIDNNTLDDAAMVEIAAAFQSSRSMAALNVEHTGISGAGLEALGGAFAAQQKLRSLNIAENDKVLLSDVVALLHQLTSLQTIEHMDLSDLHLEESEDLLRALMGVFASNLHLAKVDMQHNPIAKGMPGGILTRDFALQLADGASLAAYQALATTGGAHATKSANNLSSINRTATTTASGNGSTMMKSVAAGRPSSQLSTFRPAWATTLPMEQPSIQGIKSELDELEEGVEDGRVPPLVPSSTSLYHPLYPGYGRGLLSHTTHISSLTNPVPFSVENSKGRSLPMKCTGDQSASLRYAPRRSLKQSPYSLGSLESNVAGLLVTEDQLRRKFEELDVDGNGYLDREEFSKAYLSYQSFGMPLTVHDLRQQAHAWNNRKDEPEKIFFEEFALLMLKLAQR